MPAAAEKSVEEKAAEESEAKEPKEQQAFTPLRLVYGLKGQEHKTVEFTHKPLGFEYSKAASCCASKGSVKITKIDANGQAATLGVLRNAFVYQVNGKDISD